DLALGRVQLAEAKAVELLAPLPECDRFVEPGLAALEPLDDLLELALRRLERGLTRHGRRTFHRSPRRRCVRLSWRPTPSERSPPRRARSRSRGSGSPSARGPAGAPPSARARLGAARPAAPARGAAAPALAPGAVSSALGDARGRGAGAGGGGAGAVVGRAGVGADEPRRRGRRRRANVRGEVAERGVLLVAD